MKKRNTIFLINLFFISIFGFLVYLWFDAYRAYEINTVEVDRYYDLLTGRDRPAEALTVSLGIGELDTVESALLRLQHAMGLGGYPISLVYGDQATPPAFVTNFNGQSMEITLSKRVTQRREQLNLLVHELSHISVWSLDPTGGMMCGIERAKGSGWLAGTNPEKVVDTSGFYRGQGVLTLNGVTDRTTYNGQGYTTEKKVFGYLKPEEYGYLLARYCAEHGVSASNVAPFLEPAAKRFFNIGRNQYAKSALSKSKPAAGKARGAYWCSNCGERAELNLAAPLEDIVCAKCGHVFKMRTWLDQPARWIESALNGIHKDYFQN